MEITVKNQEKKTIPYGKIEPGQVYEIVGEGIALKLHGGEAVLLKNVKDDWLVVADRLKGAPATKILGRISEVIVT